MKRSEMIAVMVEASKTHSGESILDPTFEERLMGTILSAIENAGMLPPLIRISTPLGPRTFFDTNEWEEYAKYDEEGYPINESK